jgi:hypothetical protein
MNINSQKQQQLITRLHQLKTRDRALVEVRESDANLGISVIKVIQGKKTLEIPLLNSSLILNRNKF